jgi:hypothetical protein
MLLAIDGKIAKKMEQDRGSSSSSSSSRRRRRRRHRLLIQGESQKT